MSNVRIATIECKRVDAVPDTLRWSFDGLTGVFIKGRPPRCHRCGAVLVTTRSRNAPAREPMRAPMRGDMDVDGEDYNDDDDDDDEERGRAQAPQPTAESTANNQEQRLAECGPTERNGDRGWCGRRSGCDIGDRRRRLQRRTNGWTVSRAVATGMVMASRRRLSRRPRQKNSSNRVLM